MPVDPQWYESFFETDEWLLLAQAHPAERADAEAAFVAERLPAGARVLDVPCGTGRISVPLAERGFAVSGLDISNRVLEVARAAAPELDFRQGDMRELPWADASFDAVLNLWTAFGYFENQEEDERALAEAARVLDAGGIFVLDTVNQAALVRGFRPQGWQELEGTLLLEQREYDLVTGRDQSYWTFVNESGERTELAFDHRLYTAPEYVDMLRRAGFEPTGFFGGLDGSELTPDAWRLVIVASKDEGRDPAALAE
jgi:ubiquinone/menaquinone biosynthesis C-methylase UbiE